MTYGTPTTCRFGVQPRPSLLPAARKPAPTMTWAEMARAEGHRPAAPIGPKPGDGIHRRPRVPVPDDIKVLRCLAKRGPLARSIVGGSCDLLSAPMAAVTAELVGAGLIEEVPAPLPSHPHRVLLALTSTGREKVQP